MRHVLDMEHLRQLEKWTLVSCLVWMAAGVSAVSLSPHDHSRHAHDDDTITNVSTSSHDHSTHHHSDVGAMTRTASLSSADDNEWTTLYETFPNDNNPPRYNEDQRLTNAVPIATTTGTLRTLVINIGTPTRTPTPRARLVEMYSQASTRVTLMSRGMATVAVEYFGRDVLVPDVGDVCYDHHEISKAARAIVETELSLDVYRSVDYVIPPLPGDNCRWTGRGGGKESWIFGYGGIPGFATIVHEWGHQYTLPHLNAIRCTKDGRDVHLVDRAGRSAGQCATAEYGGAFSIMGPAIANNSAAMTFGERSQVGWLRAGEEQRVHEGVYTLGFDGPLSLLWLQNSEGDVFQIEFVKAFTKCLCWRDGFQDPFSLEWHLFSSTPNYSHPGVMVKYLDSVTACSLCPAGYKASGFVIDATPETMLSTDAAFRAGTTFIDPTGSLTVEVLSVGEQSAEVRVKGVPHKPGIVKGVSAVATDVRGVFDVTFTPTESNPAVTHYEVQVADGWDFKTAKAFAVPASPGRVTNLGHDNTWTYYRVAAVSSAGRGEFSTAQLLQWPATARRQMPGRLPNAVVRTAARAGIVDVSWDRVEAVWPVTHYEVHVADEKWVTQYLVGVDGLTTRLQIPNVEYDKTYIVYMRGVNAAGAGDISGARFVRWARPVAPSAPFAVAASAGATPGQATITWSALSEWQVIDNYEIEVATSANFAPGTVVATVGSTGTSVSLAFAASRGVTYFVRVSGVNLAGKGAPSAVRELHWQTTTTVAAKVPVAEVRCKKGKRTRTFVATSCPSGWVRAVRVA